MSKLYVFGIGGTGARVLKSLTMLLASGVKCSDTIVPIIIDPDHANADLTRTVGLIKCYSSIRGGLTFNSVNKNQFFETPIDNITQNYILPLNGTTNGTFADYMRVSTMNLNNQAMMKLLFSNDNLASDMKVGFKGNPNIGSIVLNQFDSTDAFRSFGNSFQQGDRIFIISSIFGGTGASGFPLLLKTLRTNTSIPNFNIIQNAPIGAVSVLPYFRVKVSNDSSIDSATFISKTKSALSYYSRCVSGNNSLDMLYYLADDVNKLYENNEGGSEQKNSAHVIELFAALSILDFVKTAGNTRQSNTIHKEFGICKDTKSIVFSDLDQKPQSNISANLTKFMLFAKYVDNTIQTEYKYQPWAKGSVKSRGNLFDKAFFNGQFYQDILIFQNCFKEWLSEMAGNIRSFAPFDLDGNKLSSTVVGQNIKFDYSKFDNYLNKQSVSDCTKEQHFLEIFYRATSKIID